MDDVVLNKAAAIEHHVRRVREEFRNDERNLRHNQRRQDSIVLNLHRACEASIALAMHVVRIRKLGIPQESRDAFVFLRDAGILSPVIADQMLAMVGFRNVAVHSYLPLDLNIVAAIAGSQVDEFLEFARAMVTLEADRGKP